MDKLSGWTYKKIELGTNFIQKDASSCGVHTGIRCIEIMKNKKFFENFELKHKDTEVNDVRRHIFTTLYRKSKKLF